jgi:hypothetical protein
MSRYGSELLTTVVRKTRSNYWHSNRFVCVESNQPPLTQGLPTGVCVPKQRLLVWSGLFCFKNRIIPHTTKNILCLLGYLDNLQQKMATH